MEIADSLDVQACVLTVSAPSGPIPGPLCSGAAGPELDPEVGLQYRMLRHCSARGENPFLSVARARFNAETAESARRFLREEMEIGQFLGLSQSLKNKLHQVQADAAVAERYACGPDADGDWIPDAEDTCPATPPLYPTDDEGCPTPLPPGPNGDDVRDFLLDLGVMFNPQCAQVPPPKVTPAGAFYVPAVPVDAYFFFSMPPEHPEGCEGFYEIAVRLFGTDGQVHRACSFTVSETQLSRDLPEPFQSIPASFAGYKVDCNNSQCECAIIDFTGVDHIRIQYRVRAVTAALRQGSWTNWRYTMPQDSKTLGISWGG